MLFTAYTNDTFAQRILGMLSDYGPTLTLMKEDSPPKDSAVILTMPSRLQTTYKPIRVIDPNRDLRLLTHVPTCAQSAFVHIAVWDHRLTGRTRNSIWRIPSFVGCISELRAQAM